MQSNEGTVSATPLAEGVSRVGVGALLAILAISVVSFGLLTPIIPLYLTAIGVPPAMLGLLVGVEAAGVMVVEFLAGWGVDFLGARRLFLVRFVGGVAALIGFQLARSSAALVVAQFCRGGVDVISGPLARALVGQVVPAGRRSVGMAVVQAISTGGIYGGAFVGGQLADGLGYTGVMWLAVVGLAMGAGATLLVPRCAWPRPARAASTGGRPGQPDAGTDQLRLDRLGTFCLLAAFVFVGWGALRTFLPLYVTQQLNRSPGDVGVVFLAAGVASVAVLFPVGRLADRHGRKPFVLAGLALATVGLAGLSLEPGYGLTVVCVVVHVAGRAAMFPALLALVSEAMPARRQGLAMGIFGASEDLGLGVGPVAAGLLWSSAGPATTFGLVAAVLALGIPLAALTLREREERLAS